MPKLHLDTGDFRVKPGGKLDVTKLPTKVKDLYRDEDDYEQRLAAQVERLSGLQEKLYAADSHSLLVIFQALDAAGKDGTIRAVFSGVNPQGCQVSSFKQPSAMELDHDFLWRCQLCLPERGRIGIFNRSYYEEVLVVRVHPQFLDAQRLPSVPKDLGKLWRQRYAAINALEEHLARSGTRSVKFFLHVSPEEQRERFLARIAEGEKHWKFSATDVAESKLYPKYMQAYSGCLAATSTKDSPWYVIPADDKANMRLIVAQVLVETLESMDLKWPKLSAEERSELAKAKQELEATK